jgi:hypothetical protein
MTKQLNTTMYRTAYVLFILLGLYQLIGQNDYMSAASCFGIGLIFDPFDKNQAWSEKPLWQKGILITQLIIAFGLLAYGFFKA